MTLQAINFDTNPESYKHWKLELNSPVATVVMDVDPEAGLREDEYQLKLNSYDLGVDIELYDLVQRLRFEHPEIKVVILTSGQEKVFCAGANIQMLAGSTHHHKVNFCKFTNETRNSIEDSTENSRQVWLAALNGTAAGGGYELALACDEIVLVDDRASTVSLPEVPLLAVLPGTGGLTRVVDKRHVRRDLADVFATKAEGIKGAQAVKWGLVDHVEPKSSFSGFLNSLAKQRASNSDRPTDERGVALTPLNRTESADGLLYEHLRVKYDRDASAVFFKLQIPNNQVPSDLAEVKSLGASYWFLALCRELDDAVLRLRFNEPTLGTWVFESEGDLEQVVSNDEFVQQNSTDWLIREIILYWRRTLNRIELSSRTIVTLVSPGSCFAGTLAELVLMADRSYMLDGSSDDGPNVELALNNLNTGSYKMVNGISRLESRFFGRSRELDEVYGHIGKRLTASQCDELGLVTAIFDDIDFDDEVRLMLEERASFSPDSLTGLEANCRFVGPETMESKIFARLSAWQNWIFQRRNAVGPEGALASYGTGSRPNYDKERV